MSFGFGFGLPSWQTLSGGFSPASLFSAGENGVWYEPSPTNGTLFQDSAGTTPVTAVEQFVGLMLDKSKGLAGAGTENIVNGNFSSGTTNWTSQNATLSVVAGQLLITGTAVTAGVYQNFATTAGTRYSVSFNLASLGTSTVIRLRLLNSVGGVISELQYTTPGVKTTAFVAVDNSSRFFVFSATASVDNFTIDDVSVVTQGPGNHAFQTNSTKRPKLAARYNLLTYSEEFDNAAWVKTGLNPFGSGSVANTTATTDPLGGNTADFIQENTSAGTHEVYQSFSVAASTRYTYSVRIKAAGRSWAQLVIGPSTYFGSGGVIAYFDLANGAVGTVTSHATALPVASITSLGNGWYQCSLSATSNAASGTADCYVRIAQNGSTISYTGDGTSGIYIWGADLRPASQATGLIGPTYQRVAAATVYDTAGFLPYLAFDGLDDSMSTNSIDFSAGDKMTVWAGVRKLSNGAQQVLTELSAAYNSNNGAFVITAAEAGQTVYGVGLNQSVSGFYLPSPFAAPRTDVVNASFNFAGAALSDKIIPRINGVQNQNNPGGSAPSVGNFGNYPLFIGARNNASNFFTGWLTSLIVRGAQSTQSQIEATEAWVNSRTGAY